MIRKPLSPYIVLYSLETPKVSIQLIAPPFVALKVPKVRIADAAVTYPRLKAI